MKVTPGSFTGAAYLLEDGLASVGKGWGPLVERAFAALPEGVIIDQVKEKFGALTIYITPYNEEFANLLQELANESLKTCEECGQPGVLRAASWLRTLCDEHSKGRPAAEFEEKVLHGRENL